MIIGTLDFTATNYSGHRFSDFYARRDPSTGPGWYVFGRNAEKYGTNKDRRGSYVMLCARPAVKPRRHPNYSGAIRRGWSTLAEARQVAAALNGTVI